jgi:hypothetical protein
MRLQDDAVNTHAIGERVVLTVGITKGCPQLEQHLWFAQTP